MGLIDTLKKVIFQKESVSSNINKNKKSTSTLKNRISLNTNRNRITYKTGMQILQDTQVATGFDILKYILSSKQWVLTANSNDEDNKVYDFFSDMFFSWETELNEVVKQQITAVLWGFSVHELLYDIDADARLYVKGTVPLHIKTLQEDPFVYDDDGTLIGIHQQYENEFADLPINKCLKYSFNANFDEDYGNGLLNDFRPIVEDKLNINNWLMTYLERHESPTLYGKTTDLSSRDVLLDALTNVHDGTTSIVVGADDDVGVLETNHRGETFFTTLQYKDNQIFRRYYLGNLLLGDNGQTGTYAQSNTQLEFGKLVFDGILEEIANGIQKQIINQLTEWNFGDIKLAPTISFDKFTSGDLEKLFNIIKPLIDSGVVDSENQAVQDSISLLFKKETGLHYTNDTEPIVEDFNFQETPPAGETLTSNILSDLNGVIGEVD